MAYVLAPSIFRFVETSNDSLVGRGTSYPFGYTLEELGLLWRVKRFRTNFDINIDITTEFPNYIQRSVFSGAYSEASPWPYRINTWNPAWDERWLAHSRILHNYARKMFEGGWKIYRDGVLYSESDAKVGLWNDNPTNRAKLDVFFDGYLINGLVYPRMVFDCEVWISSNSFYRIGYLTYSTGDILSDNILFSNPIDPSETTPLYVDSSLSGSPSNALLKILPEEYYQYDPGDTDPYPGKDGSGPIYDSATGAQLRNPFAIVKRGDGTFYNPNYVAP
ncbi:MAG TPA: hypothetical protein VNQ90_15640 [Chthoniobacteraceae bacterium]|nr:hypothetical protein [Chthoniobacteraceae bacterium]